MQAWLRISLLLCTFGFFHEMRPFEPFAIEYLTGPDRNITSETLNQQIYPFGTYAVLVQLVLVFLVTDILRYKPIIILSACAGLILVSILLWTNSVWELLIGQVFYGTFMASEVAYYTYIYAKVDKEHYQIVSGHTRSAILCGKFLAGVLAQVLISTGSLSFKGLLYISFGSQIVSLIISITLPSVPQSIYFYKKTEEEDNDNNERANNESISSPTVEKKLKRSDGDAEISVTSPAPYSLVKKRPRISWRNASRLLLQHTVSAYSNSTVLKWSIWWSLATCGQLQVISYAQILWKEIDENNESVYNGAVEATVTLLGAAGAMAAGLMKCVRKTYLHLWIITVCSILMGACQMVSAATNVLWLAYAMYILFGIIYFFVITIASAIVAHNLSDDSFGLIFGINTLVALALQTALTLVVVVFFGFTPRDQYMIYGAYFVVMAVIYGLVIVIQEIVKYCKKSKIFAVNT